jgi:hypothetical protein
MNESLAHPSYSSGQHWPPMRDSEPAMWEKCKELDQEIDQYRELSQSATDQPTIDRFKELIRDLFEQKIALHTTPAEPKK